MLYYLNLFVDVVGVFVSSTFFLYFIFPIFCLVFILIAFSFIITVAKGEQ